MRLCNNGEGATNFQSFCEICDLRQNAGAECLEMHCPGFETRRLDLQVRQRKEMS